MVFFPSRKFEAGWRAAFLIAAVSLVVPARAIPQGAPAKQTAKRASEKGRSGEPSNAAGSAQAANGAAPGQPTAPKPITAAHLAALPQPLPKSLTEGIDVQSRSKNVLEHVSQVIRLYRMSVAPIQKVGEPSDVLYAEQAQSIATQVAQLAFQSARDEAALLSRVQTMPGQAPVAAPEGEAQKLRNALVDVDHEMQAAQQQADALDGQLAKARGSARADLEQQKNEVAGEIELLTAEQEALQKVAGISASQNSSGLQGDIDKLQHSVPEVIDNKVKPVANSMQSLGSMRDAGVVTQAQILFQLLSSEHAVDDLMSEVGKAHQQADELRTPLLNILRATLDAGKKLQQETSAPNGANSSVGTAPSNESARKRYDQLTDAYKSISGVAVPISQELLLLEQARGNLLSWRAAVDAERQSVVHALLLRVVIIALALLVVLGLGEVWRRAVSRYVQDLRRRRQLLVIRRMVIGFLSGLVLILGFVTQFSSLATFAGFITAGLAVGLQSVLLSVAAYFFIVGRYGVKVGDRITVAGVTGDVVEVGLVRFYLMELAGAGSDLHSTGRIAVFANSVLFQTGTPLYKQIPGTNYAWHEVTVKLKPGSDYQPAMKAVRNAVDAVYAGYRAQIEQQHAATESWMDTTLPGPEVESRLQLSEGFQFTVLYPVEMGRAAEIDQQVAQSVLDATAKDPGVAAAVDGPPVLKRL